MPRPTTMPGVPTRPGRLVLALVALLLIVGTFVPGGPLWGVHAARFLPTWAAVALVVLLVASFLIQLPAGSRTDAPRAAGRRWSIAAIAGVAWVILALVAGPATQLLGDGQLIARNFQLALDGDENVMARGPGVILREDAFARGTTLLYFATTRTGHVVAEAPALTSLTWTNALVGALFVAAVVGFVGGLRLDGDVRRWILMMALVSPSSLVLLGYVENYTPLQVALGLYTLTAIAAIARHVSIFVPITLWILAVVLHVQAIVLLPSLVVLLGSRVMRTPLLERAVRGLPLVASIAALLLAIALAQTVQRHLLPLTGKDLTLLSLSHLLGWANALILVFPLAPLVVLLFVSVTRVVPAAMRSTEAAARSFVLAYLGPGLVYSFVVNPELGMARDWDRGAFLCWGWVAMGAIALVQARRAGALDSMALRRLTTPALGVALFSTVSWVAVNASTATALERMAWIVEHDVHGQAHGFEALARYHSDRGEYGSAGFWAERSYEHARNPRLATLAAQHLERAGLVDEARALLERAFARRPEDHRVRHELIRLVADTEDWPRVLELAVEGAKLHPDRSIYCFFTGESLLHLGRAADAARVFENCLLMGDLPPRARTHIERSLQEIRATPTGQE